MAAANDQVRKRRVDRIRPFLKDLSNEREPKTNKGVLLILIQDLKDEGNQLFKDGDFTKASTHYKNALFVAGVLDERFYHEVDEDFMATLFANGSLSYLKTNNFAEALHFSDSALRLQPDNVKAKYRKVQALLGLKRYSEALVNAQEGMKRQPSVFKECFVKAQEGVVGIKKASSKSATASATDTVYSAHTADSSNEWLAGTNALKTEEHRKEVLKKMPKKKKPKNPQPLVSQAKESSDSDVDSDSSDLSEDDHSFANNYASRQRNRDSSKQTTQKKNNVVRINPLEPDQGTDVLQQSVGFRTVGGAAHKGQPNGMGLDDFSVGGGRGGARPKGQGSGPKLPYVNINCPLDDTWQFRVACKFCFRKIGEGYKGYQYSPGISHSCGKDVWIVRRKSNESLNWMKVRPYPAMFNNRFLEFKMCQQFSASQPCKIGESRCTFPHNKKEMEVWYLERDRKFDVTTFLDELRKNNIDSSEQLAARAAPQKPEQQHIPGLNFKTGSRQRLSSPAPLAEPASRPAPASSAPPAARPPSVHPPQVAPFSIPPPMVTHPPPGTINMLSSPPPTIGMPPKPMGKGAFMSQVPLHMTSPPPQQPLMSRPPPPSQPAQQLPQSSSSHPHALKASENVLKEFEHKIVCPQCFIYDNAPGKYHYAPSTHVCEENVLIVKPRSEPSKPWFRVRERTTHRDFPGNYILCHSVLYKDPTQCRFGEGNCSFAHNEPEQHIWHLEKAGRFSITDFIVHNRQSASFRGFTIEELLKKYGGFFTFVCRKCFYGRPPLISEIGPNNTCAGTMQHRWDQSRVLAHVNRKTGEVTPIDLRKFTHKGAFFRICKFLHFCKDQVQDTCLSAHSIIERDVWMLERDTGISRDEIVEFCRKRSQQPPPEQQQQQQQQGWGAGSKQPKPSPSPPSNLAPPTQSSVGVPGREKVPYIVQEYCGMCWTNGTKSLQDGTANRCVKGHPNFLLKRVSLIVGIFRELRSLPGTVPRNLNFTVCRYVQLKKKCQFPGPGPCQFAHSEEERVLWIWMARNKVHKVEDVVKACKEDVKKKQIQQGDSVVAAQPVRAAPPPRMPTNLQNNSHYCRYCSVQCNSEFQWDEHTASEKHTFNVNSDRDHQWNYRQPPWGQGNNLIICSKHMDGKRCPYSDVPDMYNLCKYAHSNEELDEWCERYEWRRMKRALAKEQNMFSYMDQLLERYNAADSRVTEEREEFRVNVDTIPCVATDGFKAPTKTCTKTGNDTLDKEDLMSETVPGVQVSCDQPLEKFRKEKNAAIVWEFTLKTQLNLERVALLYNNARLHFFLQCADGNKQIATGEQFEDVDNHGLACYRVNVHFQGGMFGSFNQWVTFDFGTKPVLLRKLNVELGDEVVHTKVKDLRQKLNFDRWTGDTWQVIPYKYKSKEFDLQLMQKYKEPSSEVVVTQDSIRELNRHNYVHKMHKMLELEEITRHKLISNFDMVNTAEVTDHIVTELMGTFHCRNGELFLRLPLTENLTEDTGAGKLILTSVKFALLTRTDMADTRRVYEALIEVKGKDFVYLTLTPVCVRELQLQKGMFVEVEVQFQMNRLHFIRMHYALDQLTSTDIVFPDVTKINPILNEKHTLKVSSKTLNQDQMQAVRFIVAERTGYTPPFIMYGPFGTGKTETLAQAAMVLLRERPNVKILICAQSNSAADLYVTKHLDPYLRKTPNSQALLLRIVSSERRINSIPEAVRKYCCFSPDGSAFEIPPEHVVKQHRVVVTTVEMSLFLTVMNLKGAFTHIFIDEAAQVLECETIMPLTLATDKTCVVLTGDHIQISPKVYAAEARRQNFGVSMLERLHQYYFEFYHQLQERPRSTPLTIFLSINYRTKMEILRFISAVFYGGPEKLTACGNIPSVVEITPLLFYTVQGKEYQEAESTSFSNMAESSEVVARVIELLENWPREWGPCAPEEIGVVTPYHDQVKRIRYLLKAKRHPDLRKVNVETVQNIQGKEFRAVFISTVRTQYLLQSEHVAKALMEAESVGGVADFAFLSDRKLLNTALTRTKSLVAVVGDPVALCAIGECIQIWRTYLKHCNNMRSIYPPNITYDSIKSQVVHLQMSPMGRRLKEVTEWCKNPQVSSSIMKQEPSHPQPPPANMMTSAGDYTAYKESYVENDHYYQGYAGARGDVASNGMPTPATASAGRVNGYSSAPVQAPAPIPPRPLKPLGKVTKVMSREDKVWNVSIVPDEILLQLAAQSLAGTSTVESLTLECVRVNLEGDQAVVTYDKQLTSEDRRQKMLQAVADGKEFDGDAEIYQDRDEDSSDITKYYNYTETTLQAMLHNYPDRFKRCSISIKKDTCTAKVLDPRDPVQEIEVQGSLRRGRAFDADEAVVELLPASEEEGPEEEKSQEKIQGRVVGILQRAIDHRSRSFVCSADAANTGLLIPVNPGVPRIFNVVLQKHVQRVKRRFVCVYQLSPDKTLTFSHYEKVEANDTEDKLFVVRYLKWLPGFFNPVGVVVGVIPAGQDLPSSLSVVDIEHHVPSQFSSEAEEEVQSSFGNFSFPAEVYASRSDLRNTWCFTIDDPSASDLQVAFSIDQKTDVSYEVCVHVTDVSYFVERGSALDQEALQRGATILPIGRDPIHMLPDRLSKDLCSLQPGADRCALSIFMTLTGSGEEWHVVETAVRPTVVSSNHRFSHRDIDSILMDIQGAEQDYLKSCVLVLYQIAAMRRKQRKGNAHLDPELNLSEMSAPCAHRMVQELLVMANHQVAELLLKMFPECTPLLHQPVPNMHKLEAWKSRHAADAINSVALTKPFLEGNKVCTCSMVCMCVFTYIRDQEVKPLDHFDVLTELWNETVNAALTKHVDFVQKAVASPDNHPQSVVALQELRNIFPQQQFVCSSNVDSSTQGHYSLNVPCYTSVTDPLRSYMSIVVQRLVAALADNQPSPYSQLEMESLVTACNHSLKQADAYASANAAVHLAAAMQSRPLTLFPVVERVDKETLELHFSNLPCIPEGERCVELASLSPSALINVPPDMEQVKLTWQERIYDTAGSSSENGQAAPNRRDGVELCADRFVSHIPPFQWQKLMATVREENLENQLSTVLAVQDHVHDSLSDGHFAQDVSSEMRKNGHIQHFAEFSLSLHSSMVVQVQVAAELTHGLMTPRLTLFSLTPTLDLCLEHRGNPSKCFTQSTSLAPTSNFYSDEDSYQQSWMPLLALEAAETAVCNQSSAVIHNVPILWTREQAAEDEAAFFGEISLSRSFVEERQILSTGSDLGLFKVEPSPEVLLPLDFLCVRHPHLLIPDESPQMDERVAAMVKMGAQTVTWVGHCVIVGLTQGSGKRGDDAVTVRVRLQSSNFEMPAVLLDHSVASQQPCTVEWIPKTASIRQMEYSTACLKNASGLARDVAVGRKPVNNIDQSDVKFLVEKMDRMLNVEQKEAVEVALKQPFTVIQGPPGSGKTLAGCHIAVLYVERNRMTPQPASPDMARTQVLICASSDTVVDAIAACLQQHGQSNLRMVRMYDEQVESVAYPVPHEPVSPSKLKAASSGKSQLQGIALHHLIRQPSNRFSRKILEFDSLFGLYPNDITHDQVYNYRSTVRQAQLQELRQAEVILATCSASADPRMAMGTNIKQIIIDSCESCMEPDSLAPVVLMPKAQQLVLLGDHKQMQPSVMSSTACSLGLSRSLVERYAETAVVLKEQYRMHKGITEISSACFYDDQLTVTTKAQMGPADLDIWPSSRAQPTAFCHVMGREETVTIVTGEGMKQSVFNAKEAEAVVSTVEGLRQKGVVEGRLMVMAQYDAHIQQIQQLLSQKNINVPVCSINQCQGYEFDYVVLSTCRSVSRSEVEKVPTSDWLQGHLGLAADTHQINVALTRARKGLIILGNKYLLRSHTTWKNIIDRYRKNNTLYSASEFIQSLSA